MIPRRKKLQNIFLAWEGRPVRPENALEIMSTAAAGKSWQEKVGAVRSDIQKAGCKGLIITFLDEIAWLFNVRGSDIPFNPLFFSYCYVDADSVKLFMNKKQASSDIVAHLEGVEICNYGDTESFLRK
jgi:Xaa-Pro aminopeptidase